MPRLQWYIIVQYVSYANPKKNMLRCFLESGGYVALYAAKRHL